MKSQLLGMVVCGLVSFIIGAVIAFFAGVQYRMKVAEAELGSAEEEAKRLVSDAIKTSETKKKEALLEAKDEIYKLKSDSEKELKERRSEVQRQERRIQQKEENLDRKAENMEKKEEALQQKLAEAAERLKEAELEKTRQYEKLQEISGFSEEQAKAHLLAILDGELAHEKALKIAQHEQRAKEEADHRAREIISMAIQRCAADHVAEVTVSAVPLPSDEMKGRIIGREGRNIRALETLTGVDLIIDDTPEAITLSCHDHVKREIARIALEKLIQDGRIHPAKIEEMVEKARREVEQKIRQDGERAVIETGVHSVHPELMRLLGRMRYRTSYGQNVLNHSIEDLARKYKESPEVIHAIEAHHNDVEPRTVVACLVQAADAISAARPGARRENLENYIKRLEKLEEIAKSFNGVDKCYAIQAGREIRVILKPEVINDEQMVITAREIVSKIENEMEYPGQIKVHLIRETRAIDYAK